MMTRHCQKQPDHPTILHALKVMPHDGALVQNGTTDAPSRGNAPDHGRSAGLLDRLPAALPERPSPGPDQPQARGQNTRALLLRLRRPPLRRYTYAIVVGRASDP